MTNPNAEPNTSKVSESTPRAGFADPVRVLSDLLEKLRRHAKKMRRAHTLQGPAEYHDNPQAMRVWQKALYHEGKELGAIVRDVKELLR